MARKPSPRREEMISYGMALLRAGERVTIDKVAVAFPTSSRSTLAAAVNDIFKDVLPGMLNSHLPEQPPSAFETAMRQAWELALEQAEGVAERRLHTRASAIAAEEARAEAQRAELDRDQAAFDAQREHYEALLAAARQDLDRERSTAADLALQLRKANEDAGAALAELRTQSAASMKALRQELDTERTLTAQLRGDAARAAARSTELEGEVRSLERRLEQAPLDRDAAVQAAIKTTRDAEREARLSLAADHAKHLEQLRRDREAAVEAAIQSTRDTLRVAHADATAEHLRQIQRLQDELRHALAASSSKPPRPAAKPPRRKPPSPTRT